MDNDKSVFLGSLYGTGTSYAGAIYDKRHLAPTLMSMQGGGREPHVIEVISMENKTVVIGQMDNTIDHTFESANRVYGTNGVSPTINTCSGGGLEPKVLEVRVIGNAQENPHQSGNIYSDKGISPTIMAHTHGYALGYVCQSDEIPKIKIKQATKSGFVECEIGGIADLDYTSSTTRRGRVQDGGRICPTLATENVPYVIEMGDEDFHNFLYAIDGKVYLIRIRKIIPLEAWRLMNFSDEDFYKAAEVCSSTQLLKQAGNSIVVNCLVAILGQMMPGRENVYKEVQR